MEITKSATLPPNLEELRGWMDDTKTRQYELARMLGMSAPMFSRYMTGQADISADLAVRLSVLTGIGPDRLVNDRATAQMLKLISERPKRRRPARGRRSRKVER